MLVKPNTGLLMVAMTIRLQPILLMQFKGAGRIVVTDIHLNQWFGFNNGLDRLYVQSEFKID